MTGPETLAFLRTLLSYDPETGAFTWLVSRKGPGAKAGQIAGWSRGDGYVSIKVAGEKHYAHRLAWLFMTGDWPENVVDHKDGNPANNRWANLRDVPVMANVQNRRVWKQRALPRGVSRHGKHGFAARICIALQRFHIGTFPTPEQASAAYEAARASGHAGSLDEVTA